MAEKKEQSSRAEGGSVSPSIDSLENYMRWLKIQFESDSDEEATSKPEQYLSELSLNGVAEYLSSSKCNNVIVLSGAGVSTSAGIPDFRSPGSGLYDNLQKYDLPSPQSIFEISYFKENPAPFFMLAKELYPGEFKPTASHYFIKLLEQKGKLLRIYTQNIDTLERVAGISGSKLVEAHGTFHKGHCLNCRSEYTQEWMRDIIFKDEIPKCTVKRCENEIVKPDIVFFGEALPSVFFSRRRVQPFASLIDDVPDTTPRLLINREKSGAGQGSMFMMMTLGGGMKFDEEDNYRDVFWEGNCDDGCRALCSSLGWLKELDDMVSTEHGKIDAAKAKK